MLEWFGPFVTAIKNAGPLLYAAALIAALLLLFLPEPIVTQIGLTDFRVAYRRELGATLILSASLLAVQASFGVGQFGKGLWKEWEFNRSARATLRELTAAEKEFLRPYIVDGQNTKYVSIYDGVANGLQAKGIIYRASQLSVPGTPGVLFPWNLQPYAR